MRVVRTSSRGRSGAARQLSFSGGSIVSFAFILHMKKQNMINFADDVLSMRAGVYMYLNFTHMYIDYKYMYHVI